MAVTEPFQFDSGIVLQQIEAKQNSLRTEFTSNRIHFDYAKCRKQENEDENQRESVESVQLTLCCYFFQFID